MTRISEYRSSTIFQGLKPLSKYLYSWPFRNTVWNDYYDNDFIYEFARVTHSLPLVTVDMTQDNVNKAVYTCKRVNDNKSDSDLECVLSMQLSPWHYLWKNYDTYYTNNPSAGNPVPLQPEDITTIYDAPDNYTDYIGQTVHDAEIAYLVDSINDIKTKVDNANTIYGSNIRIGSVDLDCEKWDTSYFNTEANIAGITNKFNIVQIRIMSTLDGISNPDDYVSEIDGVSLTWYIKGGSFGGYSPDGTSWDNFYAYDSRYHTQGMIETIGCASIYTSHNEVSVNRYLEAIEHNALNPSESYTNIRGDAIAVYFSLCTGYNPINQYSQAEHKVYKYIDNPVINSYKMGRKMAGENSISIPIEKIHLWPAPFIEPYNIKENVLEPWYPDQSWGYDPSVDFTQTGDTPYPTDPSNGAQTDFVDHWIEFIKGHNDVDNNVAVIYEGETVALSSGRQNRFYFEDIGDEATVSIDGNNYIIGSLGTLIENAQFVWDRTGDVHTFTYDGESIIRGIGGQFITITYDGGGSYLFTVDILSEISAFYKIVSDLINSAQSRGSNITQYFNNMLTTLSDSEIIRGSTDRQRLESQINVTSDVMNNYHQNYSNFMKDFVFTLQKYIDDNYSSVDDFLSDSNIQVLPIFADISRVVGYLINAANIDTGNIS